MRHIKKLAAVSALAATTALLPLQSAEAHRYRGLGWGIAGAAIGTALIAGAYGYPYRYYDGPRYYYYDGPRYVYGSSYYYPRPYYYRTSYYYRPYWRHHHRRHWHRW
jgi:hypothetical protein